MIETIRRFWPTKVLFVFFLFFSLWWFYITLFLDSTQSEDPLSPFGLFGSTYGILAAWSAIVGFYVSRRWGGWRSLMGRAIIMFSLGLMFQVLGQVVYSYYIFIEHIDIPYPSLGDVGFFGTIFFYIYGIILIAHASGIKFSLSSVGSKIQVVLVPFVILLLSYFLILRDYSVDLSQPLATFLNYAYPLGSVVYISIALLTYSLTRSILGGTMRHKILFIIFAFFAQFIAEYCFIIFQNSYYPGSVLDYIYAISYTIFGFGIFQLFLPLKGLETKKVDGKVTSDTVIESTVVNTVS